MSKISIDTTKLKASGESIVSIAEEFNSIIEDIFTKLKSMDTNGTWSGIKEKIENCRLDTKTYYEWIANSVSSIENIVNKENDNLQQIKVTEIKGRKSIVK